MKKNKPINGTEQMSQFSDAFFVRVARIKYPGYDHYVLLREKHPLVDAAPGAPHGVALVNGFEIRDTVPVKLLWEAYQAKTFDKQAVRYLKLNGDKPTPPDPENLIEGVLEPLAKEYGAQGAQLIVHFEKEIKTASYNLSMDEAREGYCTGIYHLEQAARHEL